ncbi:MAG: dihydrofolate reductase [Peptococcaceae bacterium]|nr:dihydrofolate reductase [Peptococcaceae bacterium]
MKLIFSADENWGIGKKGELLYRIAPDMQYFRENTIGGVVVMGRKTLESLPGGKPLKDRVNIVLTRNPDDLEARFHPANADVETYFYPPNVGLETRSCSPNDDEFSEISICQNLAELFAYLRQPSNNLDKTWVIGGAEIFQLLMPYCHEAHVTRILTADGEADCWMENLDQTTGWYLAETGEISEWQGLRYRFDRYINKNAKEFPEA